jgi:hypothetical protein
MDEKQGTRQGPRYQRATIEQLNAALVDDKPAAVPHKDKLAAVAALINGGEPPAQQSESTDGADTPTGSSDEPDTQGDNAAVGDPDGGQGSPDEPGEGGEGGEGEPEPLTLDAVAERLELTKAELNQALVRVGPDTMTLGELKAKLPELAKLDETRAQFDERVGTWELQKVDAERQILAVIDSFPPGSVPPAVFAAVEARHNQERQRQAGLLVSARPSWGDPKFVETQRGAINKIMSKYGLSAAELATVVDHRFVLAMQDFAALSDRLEKLKESGQRREGSGGKPPSNKPPAANGQRAPQTRRAETAAKVAGIMGRR